MTRDEIALYLFEKMKKDYDWGTLVVTEESRIEDLGLDSFDRIELWLSLEEEFKIDIPEDQMRSCVTLGNLLDLLVSYLKTK